VEVRTFLLIFFILAHIEQQDIVFKPYFSFLTSLQYDSNFFTESFSMIVPCILHLLFFFSFLFFSFLSQFPSILSSLHWLSHLWHHTPFLHPCSPLPSLLFLTHLSPSHSPSPSPSQPCRGKKGVDLEYLLGCGVNSTPQQNARALDVLTVSGVFFASLDIDCLFFTVLYYSLLFRFFIFFTLSTTFFYISLYDFVLFV
jgi:hypothetical protein